MVGYYWTTESYFVTFTRHAISEDLVQSCHLLVHSVKRVSIRQLIRVLDGIHSALKLAHSESTRFYYDVLQGNSGLWSQ